MPKRARQTQRRRFATKATQFFSDKAAIGKDWDRLPAELKAEYKEFLEGKEDNANLSFEEYVELHNLLAKNTDPTSRIRLATYDEYVQMHQDTARPVTQWVDPSKPYQGPNTEQYMSKHTYQVLNHFVERGLIPLTDEDWETFTSLHKELSQLDSVRFDDPRLEKVQAIANKIPRELLESLGAIEHGYGPTPYERSAYLNDKLEKIINHASYLIKNPRSEDQDFSDVATHRFDTKAEVSHTQASQAWANSDGLFVDTRTKQAIKQSGFELRGFVNIPVEQIGNAFSQLSGNKTIYFIDNGDFRSHQARALLLSTPEFANRDMRVIRGGIYIWTDLGSSMFKFADPEQQKVVDAADDLLDMLESENPNIRTVYNHPYHQLLLKIQKKFNEEHINSANQFIVNPEYSSGITIVPHGPTASSNAYDEVRFANFMKAEFDEDIPVKVQPPAWLRFDTSAIKKAH